MQQILNGNVPVSGNRPVTWLCIGLSTVFALLMLFIPYQFQSAPYQAVYPYLRLYGAAFLLAGLLSAAWAMDVGIPRWADVAGKGLLTLALLALAASTIADWGIYTRQMVYILVAVVTLAGARWPNREVTIARLLYIWTPLLLGLSFMLNPQLVPPSLKSQLPSGLPWLFAATGLLQALASTLARRWAPITQITLLLTAVAFVWFSITWWQINNWTGVGLHATLAALAVVWSLYLWRPWKLRIQGLQRRIMALSLALAVIPIMVLGAVTVYAVQNLNRSLTLSSLRGAALQLDRDLEHRLSQSPAASPDPTGLTRELAPLLSNPKLTLDVIRLTDLPPRWPADQIHALVDVQPNGQWRLAAYVRRPEQGLAVLVTGPASELFREAESAAAWILLAAVLVSAAAAAVSLPLSRSLTRRLGEVRDVAAAIARQRFEARSLLHTNGGDEVALLATTINRMAEDLESYTEELRAQSEELQAQNEEIQAQNEELQAQTEELQAQSEELQAQSEELRHAYDTLEENLALLDTLLTTAPVGFAYLDRDLRFVRINDAMAALQGLSAEKCSGRPVQELFPWTAGVLAPALAQVLGTGDPVVNLELAREFPAGSGTHHHWLASLYPIRWGEGQPAGIGVVVTEVTEHKRMEEELRKAERAVAQEREQSRTRFLQIAAHELRNPMAGVKAIVSLLKRRVAAGRPLGDLTQQMDVISHEVDRLSALLNEILEAFRLQEGRLTLRSENLNLTAVLTSALQPFRASQDQHRFILEQPAPGAAWVLGDATRLEEVFRNLISNAAKYSPDGGDVHIRMELEPGRALVSVTDTGLGIPADQQDKIFQGFFRASNLAGRDPGGMGLGLYICREIIQGHRGRIWVESTEGKGATFYVELPTGTTVSTDINGEVSSDGPHSSH